MDEPGRRWTPREAGLGALLLVVYGWAFPFFPALNNPNEMVRVYMARAMAEHRTYVIGTRVHEDDGTWGDHGPIYDAWGYVNDKALVCTDPAEHPPGCAGKLYSAKAPGASFAAVPVVMALDLAFRVLLHREPGKDAYVFTLRWVLGIIPTVLMWLAIRRFLRAMEVPGPVCEVALLAGALGSLSLTYGQMFAGHQLASLALMLAFLSAFWPPRPEASRSGDETRALLIGVGLALAVSAEYQAAPAAAIVLLGWIASRRPAWSTLGWTLAGALPSLLLTARFHSIAFGAPWRTPYGNLENASFVRDLGTGPLGLSWPSWERIDGSLLSPRLGLLFWAPWVALVAFAADGVLPRRSRPGRVAVRARDGGATHAARVACLVIGYYLVFQVCHSLWGSGWTVGPRYVTPIAPFAAVAIALAIGRAGQRVRSGALSCFAGAGSAGILATGLTSLVGQGFPPETAHPLVQAVGPLLRHGYVARNPLQALGVPGVWSALPTLLGLAVAVMLCLRAAWGRRRASGRLAIALFLLLAAIQWTWPPGADPEGEDVAAFLAAHWVPNPPPGARPFASTEGD